MILGCITGILGIAMFALIGYGLFLLHWVAFAIFCLLILIALISSVSE